MDLVAKTTGHDCRVEAFGGQGSCHGCGLSGFYLVMVLGAGLYIFF